MKKFSLLLAILPFLVACGNQAIPKETSAQKTIVVATAGDVPPFDYEDKGNLTGFDIEVLKAVDEKLSDYEIQFQRTAWESIFVVKWRHITSCSNDDCLLGVSLFRCGLIPAGNQ